MAWGGWGMEQAVTIAPRTGQDVHAKPTFGTSVSHQARVVGEQNRVWDQRGREVISTKVILLDGGVAASPDVQVTLSTDDALSTETAALQPPVVAVGRYPDETGENHYTALFL